jgi:hypothetical protein
MLFFFDIHLDGRTQFDDTGQDFNSAEEAMNYVCECARICYAQGNAAGHAIIRQTIVEITDREGLSEIVRLEECVPELRTLQKLLASASAGTTRLTSIFVVLFGRETCCPASVAAVQSDI